MATFSRKTLLAGVASVLLLSGCAQSVQQQALVQPELDITHYFSGPVIAHGMVQDWRGKVRRQFVATMQGDWAKDGNSGTLSEAFTYDNGEKQTRVWTFRKTGARTWTGTAGDVLGAATGVQYGNALQLQYRMDVPVGGRTWRLLFDDRLYLQDDEVLLNRAVMRKFGLPVGSLTVVMRRQPEE
jgi:hypothetical protein